MILSVTLEGSGQKNKRFVAPPNKVYAIKSVLASPHIVEAATGAILVVPQALEIPNTEVLTMDLNYMYISTIRTQGHQMVYPEPVRTKYITVGSTAGSSFVFGVVIDYELVNATRSELIWEFVRRGKRP